MNVNYTTRASDVNIDGLVGLSLGEKQLQCAAYGRELPLPFPVVRKRTPAGTFEKVYVIPRDRVAKVVRDIYGDAMPDIMLDIHSGGLFRDNQLRVIRYAGRNLIVTPGYLTHGGMLPDMVTLSGDGKPMMVRLTMRMWSSPVLGPEQPGVSALRRHARGEDISDWLYRYAPTDDISGDPMDVDDLDTEMSDQAEALFMEASALPSAQLCSLLGVTRMNSATDSLADTSVETPRLIITVGQVIDRVMRRTPSQRLHLIFSAALHAIMMDDWETRPYLSEVLASLPYRDWRDGHCGRITQRVRAVARAMMRSGSESAVCELTTGPSVRPGGRDNVDNELGDALAAILDMPRRVTLRIISRTCADNIARDPESGPAPGTEEFLDMVYTMYDEVRDSPDLIRMLRKSAAGIVVQTGDVSWLLEGFDDEEDED